MIEALEVILCGIGICAVIIVLVTALADAVKTRNAEKRERQKQLKTVMELLESISEDLSEMKSILEYK